MSYPDATVEQYKQALIFVKDKHHISRGHKYLDLLFAHARAEDGTITASKLAEELGYASFGAVNLSYGKYAHLVAEALSFCPDKRKDKTSMWWSAFSAGNLAGDDTLDGQFEMVMHPALKDALLEMKWVTVE